MEISNNEVYVTRDDLVEIARRKKRDTRAYGSVLFKSLSSHQDAIEEGRLNRVLDVGPRFRRDDNQIQIDLCSIPNDFGENGPPPIRNINLKRAKYLQELGGLAREGKVTEWLKRG